MAPSGKKKKILLSIMEAICLHVHPVTKPQPPHAHTDFPGPGRNNQHMRGKGRTPRLPLDQHQYTHSCYFGNIWVYLTEHFMHSSSTCIATNKGFSNAGMYKYSFSHRDIVIQFKCLELQLLKWLLFTLLLQLLYRFLYTKLLDNKILGFFMEIMKNLFSWEFHL